MNTATHRLLAPTAAVLLATLTGCGGGAPAEPKTQVAVVPHIRPELPPANTAAPVVPPPTAQKKDEPVAAAQPVPAPAAPAPAVAGPFAFPGDTGGKKLAAMLATPAPPVLPLPGTSGPKPRASALDRGEVPLPKVVATTPTLPLPKATTPRPTPPAERVPVDLGQAAAEDPALVKLPNPPGVRSTALVNLGAADLPLMATPLPSRAPLADPTADLSEARVVVTEMPVPALPTWFLKFGIPDPFEFAAHMRSKTATDAELGTSPTIVTPAK